MISFWQILQGELLKTKGSWGLAISLLGPAIVSLIAFLYFVSKAEDIAQAGGDPWINLGRLHFNFFFLLYPLFTALAAFLISNVEHSSRGFYQLFTLPAPRAAFYLSKLLILLGWLSASLLLATGLVHGLGHLLDVLFPDMGFGAHSPGWKFLRFMWKLGATLLSATAIHYMLSIYFHNFIIPIGAACFLLVLGLVAGNWEHSYLIPYSYFSLIFMEYLSGEELFTQKHLLISLGYTVVFFAGGYLLFTRKEA